MNATSEEWTRYYAETALRTQHGRNDPIDRARRRARSLERYRILTGLSLLSGMLVAYFVLLAP
ncbi:MAG TPA: hypothetical protein VH560_17255 [Polyangia bacterium]|nr:hypothetical protein [Polyangia bacterium]